MAIAFLWVPFLAFGQGPETRAVTYRTSGFSGDASVGVGQQETATGEVLKEFADGSLLLLARDGQLLTLRGAEVIESQTIAEPMQPATNDEVVAWLKPILGEGFEFHRTKHYLIAYDTSEAYAQWVGQLFERLYRGFHTYWDARRFDLGESRFPLVAIVFSSRAKYLAFAERDIGETAQGMIGYYNMNSNRMVMYDLTGVDGMISPGQRVSTQALVNQVLSQPQAERTVATIVHEAVHQLAFNSGLQVRLADNPLWLSEGLAMCFEAPDLRSPNGWKMGNVNYHNLQRFVQYSPRRPEDSLLTLIQDDERFKNADTAVDAYGESWALAHFLMKARSKQFAEYLREIGKLEPLQEPNREMRALAFERHFGDLQKLNRDFLSYIRKVR